MRAIIILFFLSFITVLSINSCHSSSTTDNPGKKSSTNNINGGYVSQEKWGGHLTVVSGCGEYHTPKMMMAQGAVADDPLALSGSSSPALLPAITPDRLKWMAATINETAWIGPWGKSFAANITSISTGIGNWIKKEFITCVRKGLAKGLSNAHPLMPPMPWHRSNAG